MEKLRFVLILAICLTALPLYAQGGSSDVSLRWFIYTPWIYSGKDSASIRLFAHIPISSEDPTDASLLRNSSQTEWIGEGKPEVHGKMLPLFAASIPLTSDGQVLLRYVPQANLSWATSHRGTYLSERDTSDENTVAMNGKLYSSTSLDANWSTLFLGYAIAPNSWLRMQFGIERNAASIDAAGSALGNLDVTLDPNSINTSYDESSFHSDWSSHYAGTAWNASFGITLGPVSYQGQMGVQLKLKGNSTLTQELPFFLDSLTLEPLASTATDWVDPSMIDPLLFHETQTQSLSHKAPMRFRIPQSHKIGVQYNPWIAADYTYWTGSFRLEAEPIATKNSLDFRRFAEMGFAPNHLGMFHVMSPWCRFDAGAFWMDHSLSPIASMTGIVPTETITWSIQLDLLPWIRMFWGVSYAL